MNWEAAVALAGAIIAAIGIAMDNASLNKLTKVASVISTMESGAERTNMVAAQKLLSTRVARELTRPSGLNVWGRINIYVMVIGAALMIGATWAIYINGAGTTALIPFWIGLVLEILTLVSTAVWTIVDAKRTV